MDLNLPVLVSTRGDSIVSVVMNQNLKMNRINSAICLHHLLIAEHDVQTPNGKDVAVGVEPLLVYGVYQQMAKKLILVEYASIPIPMKTQTMRFPLMAQQHMSMALENAENFVAAKVSVRT